MITRYSDGTFDLRHAAYNMGVPVVPATTKPGMIWVDIETTGLSPKHDLILEIGMIGTTRTGEIIDGMIAHSYPDIQSLEHVEESIDPFVKDMHEKSGLWVDLEVASAEGYSDTDPAEVFTDWWRNCELDYNIFPMCGSSVHFDRAFLAEKFPTIETLFHYRNLDISTLKIIAAQVAPSVTTIPWPQAKAHRVIPDIIDSIIEYRHYLKHMILTDEEKSRA
jgi:oligoribonuclease